LGYGLVFDLLKVQGQSVWCSSFQVQKLQLM